MSVRLLQRILDEQRRTNELLGQLLGQVHVTDEVIVTGQELREPAVNEGQELREPHDPTPYAVGGGWFDIPGAGKTRGEDRAREILKAKAEKAGERRG